MPAVMAQIMLQIAAHKGDNSEQATNGTYTMKKSCHYYYYCCYYFTRLNIYDLSCSFSQLILTICMLTCDLFGVNQLANMFSHTH